MADQSRSNTALLRDKDVAEQLGVSIRTTEKWRSVGAGPPYIRVGRLIRYKQGDIDRWIEGRRCGGGGR